MAKTARVMIVDHEDSVRESLAGLVRALDHKVTAFTNGQDALKADVEDFDIVLLELVMPDMDGFSIFREIHKRDPTISVIVITGHATMDAAIGALRLGASDFLLKPLDTDALTAALEKSARLQAMRTEQARLRGAIGALLHAPDVEETVIGDSAVMDRIRKQVELAATPGCRSVLITGETGTGKEVVARAVHQHRHEPSDPFIAVNCPALPENLIESELFGHVRGAFTGATSDRLGAFELADGGTLFLDEVADLSPAAQAKLLRVLETRTTRRVGSGRDRTVDVKVLAATNCDLEEKVREGLFRADLLFRINLFQIELPPLRERLEDVPQLATRFLEQHHHLSADTRTLSDEVMAILSGYHYPGNIRELKNIVERAVVLAQGDAISPEHIMLPRGMRQAVKAAAPKVPPTTTAADDVAQQTRDALKEHRWNRRKAAKALDISYESLRWRISKYGLDKNQ